MWHYLAESYFPMSFQCDPWSSWGTQAEVNRCALDPDYFHFHFSLSKYIMNIAHSSMNRVPEFFSNVLVPALLARVWPFSVFACFWTHPILVVLSSVKRYVRQFLTLRAVSQPHVISPLCCFTQKGKAPPEEAGRFGALCPRGVCCIKKGVRSCDTL